MTININKLVLALAISIFSCTATPVANDESLVSDLIEFFESEIEFLNDHKTLRLGDAPRSFEQDYHSLRDCEKHVVMLRELQDEVANNKITLTQAADELISINLMFASYSIESMYLNKIIAAVFFDSRHENNTKMMHVINLARVFLNMNIRKEKEHHRVLRLYLGAKIACVSNNFNDWVVFLKKALWICNNDLHCNNALHKLVNNEFTKLQEYYQNNRDEIDKKFPDLQGLPLI